MNTRRRTTHDRASSRRGFTLIESLMAAGVLFIIVTAVALAVSSGQQHGQWAQMRIAGTLAADELMCRLQAVGYDELRNEWDGHEELPGQMVDVNGNPLPASFRNIGRSVKVRETLRLTLSGGAEVLGRNVVVRAFDANDRTLAELRRFVPQPISLLELESELEAEGNEEF